jgi:uncharacterized protein (AIM24 family)
MAQQITPQWQIQDANLNGQQSYTQFAPPAQPATYENNIIVVERFQGMATCVEIHEYKHLGITEIWNGHLHKTDHSTLRRLHVHLQTPQAEFRCETGALHYMHGKITLHSDLSQGGPAGLLKKAISASLTQETTIKPRYVGVGHWYSEPTTKHFATAFIDTTQDNSEVIVDKGMYYASEGSIEVGVAKQQNVSSALFGGEGLFQTRMTGRGWIVLELPVPVCEVHKIRLAPGEKLSVDGNYACLRRGKIEFKVEKATKGLFGSSATGEGLLQVFEASGPSEVWVCATILPPPPQTK